MRLFIITALALGLNVNAFAQQPNNITVNCFFEPFRDKVTNIPQGCHAVANIFNVGQADDRLLVNCPGLGTNTIVYNDVADYEENNVTQVYAANMEELPLITLPGNAFECRQTPEDFNATLDLPERSPYNGATLEGSCRVVTAGCPSVSTSD
jgi:hypothetical protein